MALTAAELKVDFAKTNGVIRALHGGNNGPLNYGNMVDLSAYHRELAIPFIRLHDAHWPNPDVVDIHVIFPNFSADPSLPESYDFTRTDEYVEATLKTGAQIVYRLGESIEHSKRKYHVHPPANYEKWAAICVGIIRHYNEGWANGFRHHICYWEIWNEPENRPAMWSGSDEDYFRLYEVAAKTIKARWPELKVGGPAVGSLGKVTDGTLAPTEFLSGFLGYCRKHALPLDFFSWHKYGDNPYDFAVKAHAVRRLLDEKGFAKTESHFNEWNYLPGNDWKPILLEGQGLLREQCYEQMGGAPGAAFSACVLLYLQDCPVDVANYYTTEIQGFGMFSFHGLPKKTFYAFKAFKELLGTPERVGTSGAKAGQTAICAGLNGAKTEAGILVSNFRADDGKFQVSADGLPWPSGATAEVFVVDATHNLERVRTEQFTKLPFTMTLELKAPAVALIKLRKKSVE